MMRHEAVEAVLSSVESDDLVLTTTGMISRETFALGDRPGNFYVIGSMGLASSLGLGLALLMPARRVIVIDGDGSTLMSLGTLPLIAHEAPSNLWYFILDNHAYESTGGQYCVSTCADLGKIAAAAGFRYVGRPDDIAELNQVMCTIRRMDGPICIHAQVELGRMDGVPRVAHSPVELRDRFRQFL